FVRAARDRREVEQKRAAEADVRHRNQQRGLVNRLEQAIERDRDAVRRRHRDDLRAELLQAVIEVEVRRKIQAVSDQLVAPAGPIEARGHDALADRNVLVHDDLARPGADDASHEVAHRERHLPPALLPGADAARGPDVRELLEPAAGAARHGSERVADHVDGLVEDWKFFSPVEERVHGAEELSAISRHLSARKPDAAPRDARSSLLRRDSSRRPWRVNPVFPGEAGPKPVANADPRGTALLTADG